MFFILKLITYLILNEIRTSISLQQYGNMQDKRFLAPLNMYKNESSARRLTAKANMRQVGLEAIDCHTDKIFITFSATTIIEVSRSRYCKIV